MRLLATTPQADLARLPVAIDLRAISVAEGVRAALSIAVIVAADQWLQWPPLLEAALGALLTCLGDSGGPIRRRLPSLLAFTMVGTAFMIGCGLSRAAGLWLAVPIGCAGVFGCTFARVWGQSSQQVGSLLVVVLILALDAPLTLEVALENGGLFAAGCLWAILLTMVIWRVYPFRPVRRAVAEIYRTLARLVADLRVLVASDADVASWDAHARGHRRAVRDVMEAGREVVQDTLRVRGQATPRASQALMRVEAADQLFGMMVALSDIIESHRDPALRAAADRLLEHLRPVLLMIAEAVAADDPELRREHGGINSRAGRLAGMAAAVAAIASAGSDPRLEPLARAIAERLQTAVMLTTPGSEALGSMPIDGPAAPWAERLLGPVRANLSWQSAILRHAVRAAVMVGPALAITLNLSGGYQHWLTITLVVTLQPFYALTWQRALERMGGTVLGGFVAGLVGVVCTTPLAIALALFPLAVLAFTLRAVNFAAFIACLTPLVVLLTEFSRPDTSELTIAALRAGYTVAGGSLAVLGCIALWPSWEPDRLRRELSTAFLAHAAFAEADFGNILGELPDAEVDRARRAAGVASNNLETSISRALTEPRRVGRGAGLQRAMVVDAALRRMAGRLSILHLDHHDEDGVSPTLLRAWRDWVCAALRALAAGEGSPGPRPGGPAPVALVRIARQIELLEGAVAS